MAVTRRDYGAETVAAARSVLVELARMLGEYREHLAVVGGWVPELLVAREGVAHIGPSLVMRRMALHERLKEKDAWDIDFASATSPADCMPQRVPPRLAWPPAESTVRPKNEAKCRSSTCRGALWH